VRRGIGDNLLRLGTPAHRNLGFRSNNIDHRNHKEIETAMGPKDMIKKTLDMSDFILKSYVKDLSDAELKIVPVEGMHPIAHQLGHLISGERWFMELVKPGSSPPLPAGFDDAHSMKTQGGDDARFLTKDAYMKLYEAQRAVTKAVIDGVADSDLTDNREGKLPDFMPTVADVLNMAGVHSLNHSGQFVAVRRLLKKPIAF
jgi:hypothetical protein